MCLASKANRLPKYTEPAVAVQWYRTQTISPLSLSTPVDRFPQPIENMTQRCTALHCAEPVAGYSVYCEAHKRTLGRHGHPLQKAVTLPELKPYLDRVTARRAKNPTNPTWALLRSRLDALTGHAAASLVNNAAGAITTTYERQTAEQLVALGDTVVSAVTNPDGLWCRGGQDA
jgi:hypothetical protein